MKTIKSRSLSKCVYTGIETARNFKRLYLLKEVIVKKQFIIIDIVK